MFRTKEAPMVNNSIQVQTTNDYSLFTSLNGNRNLNKLHVKRLKESMQKKYLFTVIVINEKYEIIDGQHRFNACKELELPIRYIIVNGYGLKEVQMLNANSKNWTADDYVTGYCDLGYEDYLTYRHFRKKYGFGHGESQYLLSGEYKKGKAAAFYAGDFKVNQFNKACEYAENITSLKELYDGFKRRTFIYAMITLLGKNNFDIDYFKDKLKRQPNSLYDCVNSSQYIMLIEEIYNYRNRNKVNLRY